MGLLERSFPYLTIPGTTLDPHQACLSQPCQELLFQPPLAAVHLRSLLGSDYDVFASLKVPLPLPLSYAGPPGLRDIPIAILGKMDAQEMPEVRVRVRVGVGVRVRVRGGGYFLRLHTPFSIVG